MLTSVRAVVYGSFLTIIGDDDDLGTQTQSQLYAEPSSGASTGVLYEMTGWMNGDSLRMLFFSAGDAPAPRLRRFR